MKPDHEYIKVLLEAFEESNLPYTDINKLESAGCPYSEDRFVFHLYLLRDQNLIQPLKESNYELGYSLGLNGHEVWAPVPLRLTAQGHEYLSAIRQIPVWEKIKENFQEASIETTIEVAKELSMAWAKKKVETLLGSGS